MNTFLQSFEVNSEIVVLSSNFLLSKTESFMIQTKHILNVDFFASKIAESLMQNFDKLKVEQNKAKTIKVETDDRAFSFLIEASNNQGSTKPSEIVFLKYLNTGSTIRQNDTRIKNYLSKKTKFKINVFELQKSVDVNLNKKYRLFDEYGINFPMLSNEQLELIKIADKNVIVQGVAGSGKTNVCIEKLVWCALKNYGGKVMYTTFSRGLLTDTKLKIEAFKNNIIAFLQKLNNNDIMFLDADHKTAIENYLGVFLFANEENLAAKLEKIIYFFENNVDYFLISDLYSKYFVQKDFADEKYFAKEYLNNIKNYQIENSLAKLKYISTEIVYKEIFGLIFGYCSSEKTKLGQEEYVELRKSSFSRQECEIIYSLAKDYEKHLSQNNMTDNNLASWEMLENTQKIPRYSLIIADEVQDFSQVTLKLFKDISLKLFCTGDALQMINPSYFSFGYLKNLLYEKDLTSVAELKNNYRNTKKIQQIIDELEKINTSVFGTHNFVTSGIGVETQAKTQTVFCNDKQTISDVAKNKFDTFTVVVSSEQKKQELRKILKNQEILTVAEIKGLERDSVVLHNLLSDNAGKWQYLSTLLLNKKTADENSVFRYYFNLFYVGISRAKQNLFVLEDEKIKTFENFLSKEFDQKNKQAFVDCLVDAVGKIEFTQEEYFERIAEFLKLEQFDNARFAADKITDDIARKNQLTTIDINQEFVSVGKYREAGIKFWEAGLTDEAKKQFALSGDKILIDFIDAISQNNQSSLNYEIVKYFLDVKDNEIAKSFVLETVKKDLANMKQSQKEINTKFKNLRGNKNGKWKTNKRAHWCFCGI